MGNFLPPAYKVLPPWALRWAAETFSTGGIVYREQLAFFEEAARDYQMHSYWEIKGLTENHTSYDDLVLKRFETWVELLQKSGRDDFKIEKDKCALINFFRRNNFPISPVLGHWTSNETLLEDLGTGKILGANSVWPVFLKCCHLTAGAMESVVRIGKDGSWATAEALKISTTKKTSGLEAWINEVWLQRADDELRVWRRLNNRLTDTVTPGFVMQTAAYSGRASAMEELRVEVVWGRAFYAGWDRTCFALPKEDRTRA
ncbi:unnamed protein product, partial [Polarella glacialis]